MWIQIHDLPELFFGLIKSLAATVEEFIFAEPKSQDFEGNFFRARIKVDVTKPLKNDVSLVVKRKREIFRVKYERLPDWCAVCGMLGHLYKECGNGIHPPSALVFKNLRADWFKGPGRGPGADSASGGGRGRGSAGRGAGRGANQRGTDQHESTEYMGRDDPILDDDVDMVVAQGNRKRGAAQVSLGAPVVTEHGAKNSPGQGPLALPPAVVPPSPTSKQESKRTKAIVMMFEKGTLNATRSNNPSDARLAGSLEESRRAQ